MIRALPFLFPALLLVCECTPSPRGCVPGYGTTTPLLDGGRDSRGTVAIGADLIIRISYAPDDMQSFSYLDTCVALRWSDQSKAYIVQYPGGRIAPYPHPPWVVAVIGGGNK